MKRKSKKRTAPRRRSSVPATDSDLPGEGPEIQRPSATLAGGRPEADWARAESSGEEAVGGTVATPDQDVVDEIGRAVGLEQPADAEVRTSDEILRERDRRRWDLESNAMEDRNP